jgi:hypothetical protein
MRVARERGSRLFQRTATHEDFCLTTKGRPVHSSVEQIHEVPKSLPAWIVIGLYPHTVVGLATLPQRNCDVAKLSPMARIEKSKFSVFDVMLTSINQDFLAPDCIARSAEK